MVLAVVGEKEQPLAPLLSSEIQQQLSSGLFQG